ncbi:hypothetical protein B0H10DRAFT_1773741 [Mycena sp. CBHHK59/15]|nr:hypothetical protein B0H10DRAFT_1773741 [Mycena sp. CBHHK59/15]
MSTTTALQALRNSGICISSDTAEYHRQWPPSSSEPNLANFNSKKKEIERFKPELSDATTNPSLVLAAVYKQGYVDIVHDAVQFARLGLPSTSVKEITALAMDRLLVQVGVRISEIVPGRVSVSVDPALLMIARHDPQGEFLHLVALLEELNIPRHRILIKIPATYAGIRAAQVLEHPSSGEPIHTNMTLIFGRVQAIACAQAGVSVISPFIGRVKDWWDAEGADASTPLSQHPGILLVQDIRSTYSALGTKTQIMAAGFRAVAEIVELGKYGVAGGPDIVTLPPHLLDGLWNMEIWKSHWRSNHVRLIQEPFQNI